MKSWFIASAVTILAVLGIRWLVKDRVSYRLRYALWLLVLLRLLIPVHFASSQMSVARLVDCETVPRVSSSETISDGVPAAAPTQTPPTMDPAAVLTAIWLAGAGTILAFLTGSGARLQWKLRRDRVRIDAGVCPVPVYRTAAVQSPCLVGLFRPVVYVTETAQGASARHVLLHEMTHLRHFDHVWTVLRCVVLAVHWFDPLVWIAAGLSKRDGELACDEGVLKYLGDGERIAYGRTLIQLSCNAGKGGTIMMGNAMLEKKGSLRQRIEAIAADKRTKTSMAALMVVLCLLTAGCTFTGAPETTLPPETVESTEEAQIRETVPEETAPGSYDVVAHYLDGILTPEEEALLAKIPGFDSGEDWAEGFLRVFQMNKLWMFGRDGADKTAIVSVEEIEDARAEPGVRIYEIRYCQTQVRVKRGPDYLICGNDTYCLSSDLDESHISGVFNS